jgi:uncharacterized protein YggU (UPF0235/DUF167 family)
VRAIAKALGVARREVSVVAGQSGRDKVIEVRGIDVDVAKEKLAEALR